MQPAADAMPSISSILIVYGPLGIMTLVSLVVARVLYTNNRADAKAAEAALKDERAKCEAEKAELLAMVRGLEERIIEKAETWMEKYNDIAKATNQMIESAFKRKGGS